MISQGESASLSCQEDGTAQSITLDATDPDSDPLQWSIASQADHGTASADAGTISYTPEEKDYNGSDSFVMSVSDSNGGSDSITVNVTIDPVNDPPTFTVGTADSVDEDCGDQSAPGLITAMSPGADNEEQTIEFTVESNTNTGLFTAGPLVDGSGTLTFTPAGNASGEATITLSAQDSEGLSADGTQTFTITVDPVNDAPVNTDAPVVSGTAHNGNTLSASAGSWNDDADGALATALNYAYQWQSSSTGAGSWSDISGATGTSYTLTSNENDQYVRIAVNCTDSDSNPLSATAYSAAVEVINNAPVISLGDSTTLQTVEDGGASQVFVSAEDADGDVMMWSIATSGGKGSTVLILNSGPEGMVTYTPNEDEFGSDSFVMSVSDSNGGSDSITVNVTIDPVNDPPTFTVGTADSVDEDCGDQSAPGLITAMSPGADNEEQTIEFTVESNTNTGLFTAGPLVDGSGTLTFTPAGNASGEATITLSAQDSEGLSADGTQTFTITVDPVNDAPVNTDAPVVSGTAHNGNTLSASAGSWNDDADGALATALNYAYQWQSSSTGAGSWSDISGATGTSYTLTSNENDQYVRIAVNCTDSDSNPLSATAYSAAVEVINNAPVISLGDSTTLQTVEDGGASQVFVSAEDADGDVMMWSIATSGGKGSTVLILNSGPEGMVTYTPNEDEFGSDSFVMSVSDSNGGSDSITVNVTIDPVNDPPTFTVGTADSVDEDCGDQSAPGLITAMSPGADNEEQTIEFTVESNTNTGLFTAGPLVDGSGTLTFTPAGNASGEATITLSAQDSEGLSADGTQTFTITVDPVNDAPVNTIAPSISGTFAVGNTLSADAGEWNDDADGNAVNTENFVYTWQTAQDTAGTGLAQAGTGQTYQPAAADSHQYIRVAVSITDTDAAGETTAEAYSVWYLMGNASPVIQEETPVITTQEDHDGHTQLSAQDADDDTLTWSIASQPANGHVSVEPATGYVTYSPNSDYNGSDSFTVSAADGYGGSDSVVVNVSVSAVNDIPTFTIGADQTVEEDYGSRFVEDWITAMSPGPGDESGQALTFTVVGNTNPALFSTAPFVDSDGALYYGTAADANGSAVILLQVSDEELAVNPETQNFSITINPVNDAPRNSDLPVITGIPHNGQTLATTEGTWSDEADGADATAIGYAYQWQTAPSAGGPWSNLDGATVTTYTVTYDENDLYIRSAVTCTDSDDPPAAATAYSAAVLVINDSPVIDQGETASMTFDEDGDAQTLTLTAYDHENDTLTWAVSEPVKGAASIDGGVVTYQPYADENGSDSFTATVTDNNDASDAITVNVTINAVNDLPTFTVGADQTVAEDTETHKVDDWITIMSPGPTNESAQTLTFTVSNITDDTLFTDDPTVDSDGTLRYKLAADANGSTEVSVGVTDSENGENPEKQTFTITVSAVNDTPVQSTDPTITGTFAAGNMLTADSGVWDDSIDDDAGTITYQYTWFFADDDTGTNARNLGSGGTFELSSAQSHRYVRILVDVTNADSTGTTQAQAYSAWYAIENTAPVITEATPAITTDEDTGASLTLHATDADDDTLAWSVLVAAVHGTASIDETTGEITYIPELNYRGADSFTIQAADPYTGTDTVEVSVTVDAINDTPVNTVPPSVAGTYLYGNTLTASEGTWNDDADDNLVTLEYAYQWQRASDDQGTDPANIGTGTTYVLTAAESHQYIRVLVTVTDTDASGTQKPQAASPWMLVGNTSPIITETDPAITTDEDTQATLTLHAADVDTDTLSWSVSSQGSRGAAVIIAETGAITYTPNADDNGGDSFEITVSDGHGGTDSVAVDVTINAVNDVPSFTVGVNQTVAEDCGAQTEENWITVMSTGPNNESAQTLEYILSISSEEVTDSESLFAVEPAVSPDGTLSFTPADDAYGNATISIKVLDNGGGETDTSAKQSFTITVTLVNDKPVITGLSSVETLEDTPYVYSYTLYDEEDGPDHLNIAYATNNTALLEKSSMVLGGSGANRTLTVTPERDRSGTVTITLTVSDSQGGVTTKTVTLDVMAENDAPTISEIADRTTYEDASTGAIGFTIGDVDTALTACTISAVSDYPTLIPNDETHITTGGSGANRTITLLPAQDEYGMANITVTVSDGSLTAETTFALTVDEVNDKPTISAISAVTIDEDASTDAISFTVADVDNTMENLTLSAAANNTALVPRGNIVLSDIDDEGGAAITVTPVANYNGTATVTVTVKDTSGQLSTSSFLLTVNAVNDPPTMSSIYNQSTNEDTAKSISVYISDIDTLSSGLTLTATASSNTDLLPLDDEHIVITGTSGTRSVRMIPLADQNGYTDITLQVSDGGDVVAKRQFRLTVNAVNDTPSFTAGSDVDVTEDCGAYSATGWAKDISTGALNEDDTLTFNVQADIESMFAVQPAIDSNGNLTFTSASNANGTAIITVSLSDDGGKTSGSAEFAINIASVNDTPVAHNLTTGLDTDEDQQLKGSLSIYDPDKDTWTYELVSGEDHNVTALTTASGGTVTLDAAAGTFIYVPFKDYYEGPDTFSYRVYDGTVYSNDAVVTIALTGINDPPVAQDGALTVDEDAENAPGALAGLVNDVDNATLVYSIVSEPNNEGTVTLNTETGAYTYSPAADYFGTERFSFRAYDGATYSNTATVTITVNAVNDAPAAQDETINLDEGKILNGMFKATDTENDAITYAVETQPASGTLTLLDANTGAYSFVPAEMTTEEIVTVTAVFKAEDTGGKSSTGTVTIIIRNVNDPPYLDPATSLAVTTQEDTAVSASVAAIDPDGDTLVYTVLNEVNHGTLTSFNTSTGSFTYTPNGNYHGTDYFTFIATENTGEDALSTGIYRVAITVTSVNDPPVAYDIHYYTKKDTAVSITPVGFDPDGNSLTYSIESTPAYGSIVNNGNGAFTYTPNGTDTGVTDTIYYTANDGLGGISENASIYVHIYGIGTGGGLDEIKDKSILQNTSTESIPISISGDISIASVEITSSNTWILSNDYGNDIIISQDGEGNYSFVLTPNLYRIGRTVITVRVTDTGSGVHIRTFILTVIRVNYNPTAYDLERTIDENTEMNEYVSGSDLNGIGLTFTAETPPANGTLDFYANGTFYYEPYADFSGDDSFTFTASNGVLSSNEATVTIHVTNLPNPPTADNASFTTDEDVAITNGQLTGGSVEGAEIVYHLVANGTLGTAVVNANGTFTYTPDEDANGTDTFTFKTEGPKTLYSSIAKVTVTITPVNDKPVAVSKGVSTFEDQPLQGYLIATDVDEDDALTFAFVETEGTLTKGTIGIESATGQYTYTPSPNANGTDTFYFKANDGTDDSEAALITITIEPQNDAPTVQDSAITVGEDSSVNGALTSLYHDVDGDVQTFTTIQEPAMGAIAFNTDGTFTYTPDENENGTDYFSYRTQDTSGLNSNVALVTVTITPENDAPTIEAAEAWTIHEDSVDQMFYFTVDDVEDNPDALALSGTWDETAIASVEFGGSGNNRWMKVTPVDSYQDVTAITITVSDTGVDNTLTGDVKTASQDVEVTVLEVNDRPTIVRSTSSVTIDEDESTNPITFTVDDEESTATGVTISAYAADRTLVPDTGISTSGTGGTRTVTVTPGADQYGSTYVYVRASDGETTRTTNFLLIVNPVNDAPVVTPPDDQTISEDGNTGDLYYSIYDVDSAITTITVEAASDNETVIIPADIVCSGNSADRVVNIKPLANQNGDVVITLTADDHASEFNTGSASFTVHVLAVNDTPTIEAIADQTIDEDSATEAILVNIGDIDDALSALDLSAISSNPSLIDESGIVFSTDVETGKRYVTLTPKADQNGSALITITVSDEGGKYKAVSFTLNVTPVNDAPTITAIADQTILEDGATQTITFNVADIDNDVTELDVYASSDNASVIPVSGFAFSGNGGERTVTITPLPDQNGNIPVALTVEDPDGLTASSPFTVNITPVNDEPSFTGGADETVLEDCKLQTVAWATNVSKGPDNEDYQALTFHLENDNNELFAADGQPTIDAAGTLTYTPADDMYGAATVTVYLTDNGGTDNGGDDTSDNNASADVYVDTFTITVLSVNDQPEFSALNPDEDITVDEDSGAYKNAWADISTLLIGPENNETQTYDFYLTLGTVDVQGNTALFSAAPAIDSQTGVISFTPATNANGTAAVTVVLKDDDGIDNGGLDTSENHTFTITVDSVNDDPTFTLGEPIVVNEDSGLYSGTYATGITAGGGTDEEEQILTFTLLADNQSLFSVQPAMNSAGVLTFTTEDDQFGSTTVSVALDDKTNTVSDSFTITINPVNDAPTFTMGANQTVWEDCDPQSITGWGTKLYNGADNESSQSLTFTAVSHNEALYTDSGLPAIDQTGRLTYTPAVNANGTDYVTVILSDDGGTLYEGDDSTTYEYAWITVLPVNDQPSFTDLGNITVQEDSTAYGAAWVQDGTISTGPADEAEQTYTFSMAEDVDKRVTKGNTSLFSTAPVIHPDTGAISFTPEENANGSATFTVALQDSGGTDREGVDTSEEHTLIITVEAVNDPPTFTLGGDVTVDEDSNPYYNGTYATGISPGGGSDEAGQTLTFTLTAVNQDLFSVQPALTNTGELTFTPAKNANGATLVTASLSDGNNTVEKTFTITVQPVNDQPTFTDTGNVRVDEDCGAKTVNWVTGYSVGPANEIQTHTFSLEEVSRTTNGNENLFSAGPIIDATSGAVTFTPAPNANGSVTFNAYLKDSGDTDRGGVNTSEAHILTITVDSVNDAPRYAIPDNVTVYEDHGEYSNAAFATGVTAGGGTDETGQELTFTLSGYDSSLFTGDVTLSNTGGLVFTPAPDVHGSTTVNVSLSDGTNAVADSFDITILSVNDRPTFAKGEDQVVLEDCNTQTVDDWATEIKKGADNESEQTLTFQVSNTNNGLFTGDGQPALDSEGTLTYTPAADAFGVATVSVVLKDDGGTLNGGNDTSALETFTITVESVNDQPVFKDAGNITVKEDADPYQSAWALGTSIDVGPSNETQTFAFSMVEDADKRVTNGNTSLFNTEPSISPDTGVISFTPEANANGSAVYTVYLKDNDGVERGGKDTSVAHPLTITVEAVNDLPTITLGGPVSTYEDNGEYKDTTYASNISPSGGTDEEGQTLSVDLTPDDASLFTEGPKLATDGQLTFTPAADAYGTTNVSVALSDGVDTVHDSFRITINPVNDKPTFDNAGDQTVKEDCGQQTESGWAYSISTGADNEIAQSLMVTVENDNPDLFDSTDGEPKVSASGTLTYTPKADAYGTANVTVTFWDDGGTVNGGEDTSETAAFAITVLSVNDQPSFDDAGNITVDEDYGIYASAWADESSIVIGPANENQTYAFSMTESAGDRVTNGNTNLFTVEPSIDPDTGAISFTPAPNANGSAVFTIVLTDKDGTDNGGFDTSAEHPLTITVSAVDDPPAFTLSGDITVYEDCASYEKSAYATNITAGGGTDEGSQELTFTLTADNTALFSEQPALTNKGMLTFTPATDAYGNTDVTVGLFDGKTTVQDAFAIEILSVNDRPEFTDPGNITVDEDSGVYSEPWAVAGSIDPGPANETQTCAFSMTETESARITKGNTVLFSIEPSINETTGAISFTTAENANGSATYTVYLTDADGVENGGEDTSEAHSLVITVAAVADAPTITLAGDVTVNEDSPAYQNAAFATGISPGGGSDEENEKLTITVEAADTSLFSAQPKITTDGELTFTPAAEAFGSTDVTVTLSDGKVDTVKSFRITVNAVNDQPSFVDTGDITVSEDSGSYSEAWADDSTRNVGQPNETQTYQYVITQTVIADGTVLFSVDPAINPITGEISFTPAENAFGSAQVTVVLKDYDGTDNGGVDTSEEHTFTITVVSVNDAPVFKDIGDITVDEDAGAYEAEWVVPDTASAGPLNEAPELTFSMVLDESSLIVNGNAELFAAAPVIDEATGKISFAPAENANGEITATVILKDTDGIENEGVDTSIEHTFKIIINVVNDVPAFTKGEDVSAGIGTGAYEQAQWAIDIAAGPQDEALQTLVFTVNVDRPELFEVLPSISADGTLAFTPSAALSGSALATVTLNDDGGTEFGGVDTTPEQQFSINVVSSNELVLTGKVISARTGDPVPGAHVQLLDQNGDEIASVTVGDDGAYAFTGLADSSDNVQLAASATGYQNNTVVTQVSFAADVSGTITCDVPLSQFKLSITADPEVILGDGVSEAVITATVTDDTGAPIRGVTATFSCASGTFKDGINSAVTGRDGSCSIVFISQKLSGTTEVSIPITVVVSSDEKKLYGTAMVFECFSPGFVEGIVTDGDHGNQPVEGAIVTVYKDFDGDGIVDFSKTVVTGSNGRYKIAVPRGDVEYNINITKPVTVDGKETQVTFEQTVQVGNITGSGGESTNPSKSAIGIITLQNENGSASYCGELIGSGLSMEIVGGSGEATVTINSETGVFSVNNLLEGTYTLNVYYEYEDGSKIIVGSREITITSSGETNLSEVLIDPYGIVTDSKTGATIQGATVKLYYANTAVNIANGKTPGTMVSLPSVSGFPPSNNSNPQQTDSAGLYAFMVYSNTDYYIVATKDGYETFTSATISVGSSIVNYDFAMTPVEEEDDDKGDKSDNDKDGTVHDFNPAIYVSTAQNRTLENQDISCTITYGNKTDEVLPLAAVQLFVPRNVTVVDSGGGVVLSRVSKWYLTERLRLLPDWVESEYDHKIVWYAADLEPGKAYTLSVTLHVASIDQKAAQENITLAAQISTDFPIVEPEDDHSYKTLAVASRTKASSHSAYFISIADNKFSSSDMLTRGDAAVIFANILGLDTYDSQINYTDVAAEDSRAGAIHGVTHTGFMGSYAGMEFKPDLVITRARFVTMIARYLDVERSYYLEPLLYHFDDIEFNWARSSIEEVYRCGIITPSEDGYFRPNDVITRGEAVVMLNRMLCRGTLTNADAVVNFADVSQTNPIAGDIAAATKNYQAMTNSDGSETAMEETEKITAAAEGSISE